MFVIIKNRYIYILFCLFVFTKTHSQVIQTDSIPKHVKEYNKALTFIDSSKYEQASKLLKKIIKKNPDFFDAIIKQAFVKIELKDYDGAEKELEKATKIKPLFYETEKLKGINYYLNNKFSKCKVAFDTALYIAVEDKIDDPEIYYYRARLMLIGKNYIKALEACESAIDLKPIYVNVMTLKAEIRFEMKNYNHVIFETSEAIKNSNEKNINYLNYSLRAKSKFEIKDFQGAVNDWNVYIGNMGSNEENLISRAAAKINVNDYSGAICDLDTAINFNSKNPVSYCYRGVAKGGIKNYSAALKDLDFSIKLKFNYSTAYLNRAAIRMALKDKHGACDDLEKADGLGNEMALRLVEKYCKDKIKH